MNRSRCFILVILFIGGNSVARAQHTTYQLSDRAEISVLTVGPGEQPYTVFGHTAIRIHDPVNNIDRIYNFGTFDIDSPLFYLKFVFGRPQYFLSVSSFYQFKQMNKYLGRAIIEQVLNLSPSQEAQLFARLQQILRAENSSYTYLFFRKNCVTKIHDLFIAQDLLQPKQRLAIRSVPTYRQLLSHYLSEKPWLHLGLNLLLGSYVDRKPVARSYSFLPYRFHRLLQMASANSGEPLVQSTRTIIEGKPANSSNLWNPETVFWALFIIITALSAAALRYSFHTAWIDRLLFGVIGLLGVIIFVLSVFSVRAPFQNNWNLLWALPSHLWIAFGKRHPWMRYYFGFTFILYGGILAGWILIPQNLPLVIIPLLLAMIVRSSFRLYTKSKIYLNN